MNYNFFFIVLPCLFAYCLCELTEETKVDLSYFNNYYNVQPNQEQTSRDGHQQNAEETVESAVGVLPIQREESSSSCTYVGCSTHVNPQAEGVNELANLGVRHLDLHQSSTKHRLESVIDVERQIQVVNGVRYILTLSINFDNCTQGEVVTDVCASSQICKITILAKPWETLPSGAKYRAILANNCTEEWLFGDNGEVLPEPTNNSNLKERDGNPSSDADAIKVERYDDVRSQPTREKTLTNEEIKVIEDQIIPYDHLKKNPERSGNVDTSSPDDATISKDHINTVSSQRHNDNNIPVYEPKDREIASISQDKRKAIDAMFDFFNFAGANVRPEQQIEEIIPRVNQ